MPLSQRLNHIKQHIALAEIESGRPSGQVLLLAVSKQQNLDAIKDAIRLGIHDFGENYLQEALPKIEQLKEYPLTWHFIGPLQSNKARAIATHFDWVHSINRIEIAQALSKHRPSTSPPLQVCLQVNLVHEPSKSGIHKDQAAQLASLVSALPGLQLRGLMTIPPPLKDSDSQYHQYLELKALMHQLNDELSLNMDTLSMGMSDDIIPAVKAGSTIIRVGRALFGERL